MILLKLFSLPLDEEGNVRLPPKLRREVKKQERQRLKGLANAGIRCTKTFSRTNNMSYFKEEEFRELHDS